MIVPSKELREAGEGAIRYALADWGKWTPEQIDNALATLGRAWAAEHADKIRDHIGREDYPHESARVRNLVAFGRAMADVIDPDLAAEGGEAP